MLELTSDNVRAYLRDRGYADVRSVESLAGGVSNVVLRIEAGGRVLVLKQSRPQLRTEAPWFSDIARIYREIDVMQMLQPVLPDVVPEVLFRDDANYAFAMSHAPEPCRDWRSVLLAGEIDPALGAEAGRILARIHLADIPADVGPRLEDCTVFHQLRTDPFYRRIRERHPDLAEPIDLLIRSLDDRIPIFLCHGDFSPKNLLLHAGGFVLVDYETAHLGFHGFDVGFFLSHLLLKAIHNPARFDAFAAVTRTFWDTYHRNARSKYRRENREIMHAAACLLARVDGTSPAPYLTDQCQRDAARRIARRILSLSRYYSDWEQVVLLARLECRTLFNAEPDQPT